MWTFYIWSILSWPYKFLSVGPLFPDAVRYTVPFKSIRQSRVTRPSKTLKCHGGHGNFCKVLNSFSDHVPNIKKFRRLRRKTAEKFPKIWTCHGKFGSLPKPKFRQACHRSHPLPNWLEWYSMWGEEDEGWWAELNSGNLPPRFFWCRTVTVSSDSS